MAHPYLSFDELQAVKTNFTMSPSYANLVIDLWHAFNLHYTIKMHPNISFTKAFLKDLTGDIHFDREDVFFIISIAVLFTIIRFLFERFICRVGVSIIGSLDLKPSEKRKLPESIWKGLFYTCTWFYCLYLVRFRYDYFLEPYLIWDDWSPDLIIPTDIKLIYFIECGFYVHSIYATLYMDSKRKDFYVMIIHHVLTIALISISYVSRYHKIGLLVLFMHDVTDICLEITKSMRYLTLRKDGQVNKFFDYGSQIGFVIFTIEWFLFRLYWFPMKVLYSSGVASIYRTLGKETHRYTLFNILLWILLMLNLYWLFFILQVLFRVLLKPSPLNGDTRDADGTDEEENESSSPSVRSRPSSKQGKRKVS